MYDIQCYDDGKVILEVVAEQYYTQSYDRPVIEFRLPNGEKIIATTPHCIIKQHKKSTKE